MGIERAIGVGQSAVLCQNLEVLEETFFFFLNELPCL
jgi:hypothetical protein